MTGGSNPVAAGGVTRTYLKNREEQDKPQINTDKHR